MSDKEMKKNVCSHCGKPRTTPKPYGMVCEDKCEAEEMRAAGRELAAAFRNNPIFDQVPNLTGDDREELARRFEKMCGKDKPT